MHIIRHHKNMSTEKKQVGPRDWGGDPDSPVGGLEVGVLTLPLSVSVGSN